MNQSTAILTIGFNAETARDGVQWILLALLGSASVWSVCLVRGIASGDESWRGLLIKPFNVVTPAKYRPRLKAIFLEPEHPPIRSVADRLRTIPALFAFVFQCHSKLPTFPLNLATAVGTFTTLTIASTVPLPLLLAINVLLAVGLLVFSLDPLVEEFWPRTWGLGILTVAGAASALILDPGPLWLKGLQFSTIAFPAGTIMWLTAILKDDWRLERFAARICQLGGALIAAWDVGYAMRFNISDAETFCYLVSVVGIAVMVSVLNDIADGRVSLTPSRRNG